MERPRENEPNGKEFLFHKNLVDAVIARNFNSATRMMGQGEGKTALRKEVLSWMLKSEKDLKNIEKELAQYAQSNGSSGKELHEIFRDAIAHARKMRNSTNA
jgi:hypothetical protein